MARWKPLADGLEPRRRELVVRLRELKDQLGISTAALARKTPYSKSSWDRYLNGAVVPPKQAVEALGRLAGTDLVRLLATWELASQVPGTRQAAPGAERPNAAPAAEPRPRRRGRLVAVAAGVTVAAAGAGLTVWLTARDASSSSPPAQAPVQPAGYTCDYTTRDGHLYAGHSTGSDRLVALNASGQDVVEVQCLLVHHDLDPGRVDGLYGQRTSQAVEQLQSAAGAVVDGIVGPQTWGLLRS
ncbi:peptidoglycan-binding protein [Amycolatopsis pithecellobii]|uniref:Helix-turn-helix domain-containing protein n=1 Tax=Amycolatopsis pithecellobii TaxID=664692 RepID=A0A6N7YMW3_9PSEU|nr:peptidoglycan-binding protein [Amycolatopsis pithecellobii]MTD54317.1 helix-turn-helix domain-containing protein [Amycolatopsis pithecellobii]